MPDSILPGSLVRSFDFPDSPHRESCYMDGILIRVLERGLTFPIPGRARELPTGPDFQDCDRYVIRVLRRVFNDEVAEAPDDTLFAFPPVNGTPKTFGDVCNGVVSLDAEGVHNV